jgi:hypothetical protein
MNALAADGLRSEYQRKAAFASATASGWKSTLGRATRLSEDLAPSHGPRNGLYFSLVQVGKASRDLLPPRRFRILVYRTIQAFDQMTGKRGTRRRRQTQRFFDNFFVSWLHERNSTTASPIKTSFNVRRRDD